MTRTLAVGLATFIFPALGLAAPPASEATRSPASELAEAGHAAPGASDAQGTAILHAIEQKFGSVMRNIYGWTDASFERFYANRDAPVAVLERALAARSYEEMLATLAAYQASAGASAMAKAFPARPAYAMGATLPGEDANPLVVQARQAATKVLGDETRDLVFIPVAPCTVWDTRYATDPVAAGAIADGATKSFPVYKVGAPPSSLASSGGNPSCAETNTVTAGGVPAAVMMTVYTNNATANGWLTLYRYGDPDPSQATISVYYAPGPTRTQTVISKVAGAAYDVSATSRFGTVDAAASVVGYFMRSPATAISCVLGTQASLDLPASDSPYNLFTAPNACPAGTAIVSVSCQAEGDFTTGNLKMAGGGIASDGVRGNCFGFHTGSAPTTITARPVCCRVPGR